MASGKPPPPYNWWTKEEEQLDSLLVNKIDIGDMAYGRKLAMIQRELEEATEKMSWEKRHELRQKSDEMDGEKVLTLLVQMPISLHKYSEAD